jgi:protein arginine kinase activator
MAGAGEQSFGPWNCKDCDKCGKKPVVTEVTIKGGKKVERKLCEQCAKSEGIGVQTNAPLQAIMSSILAQHGQGGAASQEAVSPKSIRCEACGLSFTEFRNKGLLGCPDCYRYFEKAVGPMIERSHDGATHHVGKVPRRAGDAMDRQRRLAKLRRELADAVTSEQYERAAELRDEIRGVESGTS